MNKNNEPMYQNKASYGLLARLSSLIQESTKSNFSIDSLFPSNLMLELASCKLPNEIQEKLLFLLNEREILFQIIRLFRYENKVIFTRNSLK